MQQMQHVSMQARNFVQKPRQMPFSFAKMRKHVDLKFKLVQTIYREDFVFHILFLC